jgi:hypothetical protein
MGVGEEGGREEPKLRGIWPGAVRDTQKRHYKQVVAITFLYIYINDR